MRARAGLLVLLGVTACTPSPPAPDLRPEPSPAPGIVHAQPPAEQAAPPFYPVAQDGHAGSVWSSAWSPSGEHLATGGFDGTVRIWDREGRLWIVLRGHLDAIKRLVFRPDGSELASSSRDGTIRVWSLSTGEPRVVLEDAGWDVDWSPDGASIVTVGPGPRSDSTLRVWRASDGALTAEVEAGVPGVRQLLRARYSSDGATVAASGNGHLVLFDAARWVPRGHVPASGPFVAAPHEATFWMAGERGTLRVVDAGTGQVARTMRLVGVNTIHHLSFARDGRWLAAAGGYERVAIIDPRSGRVRNRFGHTRFAETLSFHPTEPLLAVAGGDTPQIVTHAIPNGREVRRFGDRSRSVAFVTFSPNGARLATAGGDHVEIWDLQRGELLGGLSQGQRARGRLDQTMMRPRWSPDGSLLAVAGYGGTAWILNRVDGSVASTIRFDNDADARVWLAWDARSETLTLACATQLLQWERASGRVQRHRLPSAARAAATDPEHRRLMLGLASGARVLALPSLEVERELASLPRTSALALGPEGARMAASTQGELRVGPLTNLTPVPGQRLGYAAALRFASDGSLAFGTGTGGVGVWRPDFTATIDGAHAGATLAVAWTASGHVASGGRDARVGLWDPGEARPLWAHALHEGRVWSVDAHPGRDLIASAGHRAWLAEDEQRVTLRVYDDGGRLSGFFYDEAGRVGGDPRALEEHLLVRSGPGVIGSRLHALEPGNAAPFPLAR